MFFHEFCVLSSPQDRPAVSSETSIELQENLGEASGGCVRISDARAALLWVPRGLLGSLWGFLGLSWRVLRVSRGSVGPLLGSLRVLCCLRGTIWSRFLWSWLSFEEPFMGRELSLFLLNVKLPIVYWGHWGHGRCKCSGTILIVHIKN